MTSQKTQSKTILVDPDPDGWVATERYASELTLLSRVALFVQEIQSLPEQHRPVLEEILAQVEPCGVCRFEARPNHQLSERIAKAEWADGTLTREAARELQRMVESIAASLGSDWPLSADIIEEAQSIYRAAFASGNGGRRTVVIEALNRARARLKNIASIIETSETSPSEERPK